MADFIAGAWFGAGIAIVSMLAFAIAFMERD